MFEKWYKQFKFQRKKMKVAKNTHCALQNTNYQISLVCKETNQ